MKLDILMHYEIDEITGEVKFIGKEEVAVDTVKKSTKTSASVLGGDSPMLKLNANNFALNEAACKLLGVEIGTTVHINYAKVDGVYVPAIGASDAFGVKAGNKLTKTLTVSYRGKANEKLAEYGDEFTFEPATKEGIFYLRGNKAPAVKEETIEIDDSFELDDLEDIDLDKEESLDISTIDLTL